MLGLYVVPYLPVCPVNDRVTGPFCFECASLKKAEKFENLITRCVWELPQKEAELEQLEKKLRQLNQELYQRQEKLNRLKSVTFDLCTKVYALGEAVDKEIKNWML